ncbi:MAG: hypothetical protein NZ937_04195 [Armatimonadetes bacterium]|nr:hypothetical protein [Armatimonadota bacterium]MDW8027310.1 hypothetical protein [Armatimonadota bacterium]
MSMVGYLMLVGREGKYRYRRDEVMSELGEYLCDPELLKKVPKSHDLLEFLENAKL